MHRVDPPAVHGDAGGKARLGDGGEAGADRIPFVRSGPVSLSGMTVLATGGLGTLAVSFALSAASAGARVILADLVAGGSASDGTVGNDRVRSVFSAFATEGLEAPTLYYADITEPGECVALVEAAAGSGLDVVVNFAGVHHPPFDIARDDPVELARTFERVVRVNLQGAFAITAAAARAMVPRRNGQIIHLCSNGSRASLYGSYAYNASKHGVEGIVKTAAAQLAPFGVRVNGVAPGTVITDLNRSLSFDPDGNPRPRAKSILAHTPTKAFATADGVAQTILAMCVPQRHMTGNVIFCDDGYNIEGHSWPEGNEALYAGGDALKRLYDELDQHYPPLEELR